MLKWYAMNNLKLYLGLVGSLRGEGVTGLVGFKLAGIKIMIPWKNIGYIFMGAPEYTLADDGEKYYNMNRLEEFIYTYSPAIAGSVAFIGSYLL